MDPEKKTTNESTVEDFERIRDDLLNPRLFEDPDFPAEASSLCSSSAENQDFIPQIKREIGRIEWKRPKEICDNPKFVSDGQERFDVVQGFLGNCWFLAALAPLTQHKELLHQVVPRGQSFEENYAGIFHFRLWRFGRWVTVIVDDRLPTIYNEENGTHELIFVTSSQSNEFWSALLEKAYAKLHGSYEALEGGYMGEGLEDFTGGVTDYYTLNKMIDKPVELFRVMLQAQKHGSLMGCVSLFSAPEANVGDADEPSDRYAGIVTWHAYSITSVKYIKTETSEGIVKLRLVRLRNPHGWGEWEGAWNDDSSEWKKVPEEVKNKLGFNHEDDGEFWMEIKDFCKNFEDLTITHLNLASDINYPTENKWEIKQFHGTWTMGVSAGGCTHCSDTFHSNPQYRITLHECDDVVEGDEDDEGEDYTNDGGHKCSVVVALTQKYGRSLYKNILLYIGFSIFKIPDPDNTTDCLDKSFFEENKEIACAPYTDRRTNTKRFQLNPGTYCVVPTSLPDEEGDFLIRIFSEKH